MTRFIPGKRILKTFTAVLICLLIFEMMKYPSPIYATIASILMMKETSSETKKSGIYRMLGTIIGGLFSLVFILLLKQFNLIEKHYIHSLVIAVTVLINLMFCKGLKFDSYVSSMSSVVIVITMLTFGNQESSAFTYVLTRIKETLIGIVVAYLVNEYLYKSRNV